jgi:hypothetical protein
MKKKEKGKCKSVVKAAAVNAYAGDSLAGVELFVNTLHSGPMPGIAVVDAWGLDGIPGVVPGLVPGIQG